MDQTGPWGRQGGRPAWPGRVRLGQGEADSAHTQAEGSNSWAPCRRPLRALQPMQQVSRLNLGTSFPGSLCPRTGQQFLTSRGQKTFRREPNPPGSGQFPLLIHEGSGTWPLPPFTMWDMGRATRGELLWP